MKIGAFKPDGWTPIHFAMGLGVALIVRSLGGERWLAFGAAVMQKEEVGGGKDVGK